MLARAKLNLPGPQTLSQALATVPKPAKLQETEAELRSLRIELEANRVATSHACAAHVREPDSTGAAEVRRLQKRAEELQESIRKMRRARVAAQAPYTASLIKVLEPVASAAAVEAREHIAIVRDRVLALIDVARIAAENGAAVHAPSSPLVEAAGGVPGLAELNRLDAVCLAIMRQKA